MILIDRYVKFLIDNQLSERQFLGLYLSYTKRNDLIELFKKNVTNGMKIIPPNELSDLITKGFVKVDMYGNHIITDKFKAIFVDKHIATEQIYEIYPSFIYSNGVQIPLSTMDRNVFANLYEIAIMGSLEEHEEILLDIKYGKEKELLNIGIEKFLKSKYWLAIRKKRMDTREIKTTKTKADNEF